MSEATFENRPFLHLRATDGYDLVMRSLGVLWFLGLAIFTAFTMTNANNTPTSLLAKSCLVMFYLIFCLLISIRPRAKAQAYGFLPRLAAFVGTYLPWTMVFFAALTNSALLNLMSSVCVIAGSLSQSLRSCISVKHLVSYHRHACLYEAGHIDGYDILSMLVKRLRFLAHFCNFRPQSQHSSSRHISGFRFVASSTKRSSCAKASPNIANTRHRLGD